MSFRTNRVSLLAPNFLLILSLVVLYSERSLAKKTRVIVNLTANPRNLSLDLEEIPTFFESFFDEDVARWAGGASIQGPYPIQISVRSSEKAQTNGRFAMGSLSVVIGKDVPDANAKAELQHIVAHELAHLIFEKFSGLPGYENGSTFSHLAQVNIRYPSSPFLVLAANELFADALGYYVTGDSEAGVSLRGSSASFTSLQTADALDPNNPYHYFSLSRREIHSQYLLRNGSFDDLGRLYSLLVIFLSRQTEKTMQELKSRPVMERLNQDLIASLKILRGYPLPHELPRGPLSCAFELM